MRDYGKVYSTFWSSQTTGQMSDDAKLLAMYLMTCSHSTIAGVYRLPDGYVSEDIGWSSERVKQGFEELFAKCFANRCETTKWVWIRKHLEWNKPENPNQRKSAAKIALSIPDECAWKLDFMRDCGEVLAIFTPENNNPSETVGEGLPNQEQEQEQKQDIGALSASPPKSPRGTALSADWELPDDWRAWAEAQRPDLDVLLVADAFRDFWIAKPGKDGRKSDWQATWRNWVRNQRSAAGPPAARRQADGVGSFV